MNCNLETPKSWGAAQADRGKGACEGFPVCRILSMWDFSGIEGELSGYFSATATKTNLSLLSSALDTLFFASSWVSPR